MLSVSAGLTPGLVLGLNRSPDPLGTRGAPAACWICVCPASLILSWAPISHPVLLWTLCLSHHPGLLRSFFFPASVRNPCLLRREATYPVFGRFPDLLLASIFSASAPPAIKALLLSQRRLRVGLWPRSAFILSPRPRRNPRSRGSH